MNNFAWAAIMHFRISGVSQVNFGSLKGCYQCNYYCSECLYSQISLKVWDSKEKLAFSPRLPLRHHIARIATFSVDPGILVSLYASAHHPHTTLATCEWMIFWPSEDSPVDVGSTECSRHLVISGLYQSEHYCREYLYSKISPKVWDSEEKPAFSLRLPLRCHIAQLATFSIDPGILLSLDTSSHHPYTTLVTGEWMIFQHSEYSPVEVGSTECSRHLVFSHTAESEQTCTIEIYKCSD